MDKNYIDNKLNQKFTCTICGSTDCVKNAFVEKCPVHSNSYTTHNLMGAGTRVTTTYYNFFRICSKCGNERKHIRKLASKSHLWICSLLLIAGIICICFYNNGYQLIIASIALFALYRGYKDIFCILFSITRKRPSIHLDYRSNSIGLVPKLWDFPTFIPFPNVQIDYSSTFKCPKCNRIMPINTASTIKHCIGKTSYFYGNFEVETEHLADVRICSHCTNQYKAQITLVKRILIVALALFCIVLFVTISINVDEWKPAFLIFLALISCGLYWGLLKIITNIIKHRFVNSDYDYAKLKNDNAIDN